MVFTVTFVLESVRNSVTMVQPFSVQISFVTRLISSMIMAMTFKFLFYSVSWGFYLNINICAGFGVQVDDDDATFFCSDIFLTHLFWQMIMTITVLPVFYSLRGVFDLHSNFCAGNGKEVLGNDATFFWSNIFVTHLVQHMTMTLTRIPLLPCQMSFWSIQWL